MTALRYTPHPTDPSLVIGDNGHVYAATRLPDTGWQFAESWEILDMVEPGAIPVNVRLYLAGVIAGASKPLHEEGACHETAMWRLPTVLQAVADVRSRWRRDKGNAGGHGRARHAIGARRPDDDAGFL
jgi:hypothetical protein